MRILLISSISTTEQRLSTGSVMGLSGGPSMPSIRDSIIIFAAEMDRKLQRDDQQKQAWETETMGSLEDGLYEEVEELHDSLIKYLTDSDYAAGSELMNECCDVALYAMMIFSQVHPLTRHNRRGSAVYRIPRVVDEYSP